MFNREAYVAQEAAAEDLVVAVDAAELLALSGVGDEVEVVLARVVPHVLHQHRAAIHPARKHVRQRTEALRRI